MGDVEYGKPIRIFYANLLWSGVQLRVDNGKLHVDGNLDILSPVYRDEIIKRKSHLVDMLTPQPPAEMCPYFGRLLKLDELKQALLLAESMTEKIDATPVNGGWLLTMRTDRSPEYEQLTTLQPNIGQDGILHATENW